jgi:hypothetical protein
VPERPSSPAASRVVAGAQKGPFSPVLGRKNKKDTFFKKEPRKLLIIKDRQQKTNRNEPEKLLKIRPCRKTNLLILLKIKDGQKRTGDLTGEGLNDQCPG